MKRIAVISFFILLFGIAIAFSATDSNNDLNFGQTANAFDNATGNNIDSNFSLGEKTFGNAKNATTDANLGLYYVSTESPTVTIVSPSNSQSTTETTIVMSYAGTSKEPIIKYFVKKDSDAWIDNGLNTSYAFTGLGIGTHSFFVIAKNSVDLNSELASVSITIAQSQQTSGTTIVTINSGSIGGTTKTITEETIERIEIFTISTDKIVQNMALNEIANTGIAENKRIVMSNDLILSRRMIEKTRKIDGQIVSTDLNFNVSAKNVSGKELKGIELIEKVPKEITENTKSINFADKPKVLKEDPLFEWLFDLNINEIKDFKYHINGVSDKSILKDMNSFFKNLAIPTALLQLEAGKEDACKGKNCNDKNPCTVDYCAAGKCIHSANDGISCDNNKVCYQGQCIEKKLIIEKICQYNQIAWLGKDCEIIMQTITTTALVIAIIAGIVFIARKRKQKKHLHKLQKAEKVQETKVEKKEEREHKQEAKKEEKPAIEEKPEKKEKKIEQLPEQEQPKPAKEKKKRKKTKKERRKEKRQRKKKKKANKKPKK